MDSVRRVQRSRGLLAVGLVLALGVSGFALQHVRDACPFDWSGATRIELNGEFGDVLLDGTPYRVGGHALLDHMPRAFLSPLDQLAYRLNPPGHPLGVGASISASSRQALGDPEFTCARVTHGSEVWSRRPTTYDIQTLADGYPPGAPPPAQNEAWRSAYATGGPEWPTGDRIGLELWASVNGHRYVFVLAPFALMKGG